MTWNIRYDPTLAATSGGGGGGSEPAYFTAMSNKEWKRVVTSTQLQAQRQLPTPPFGTGNSELTWGTFCGACVDPVRRELLSVANGGHTDYAGNESYAITFGATTPAVYRLYNRTPDGSINYNVGGTGNVRIQNADGLPRAGHSWDSLQFAHGRAFMPYISDPAEGNPGQSSGVYTLSRDWLGDTYANFPIAYATIGANAGNNDNGWFYRGLKRSAEPPENCPTLFDSVNDKMIVFHQLPAQPPDTSETAWEYSATNPSLSSTAYDISPVSGNPVLTFFAISTNTTPALAIGFEENSADIYIWNLSAKGSNKLVRKVPSNSSSYSGGGGWYGAWHAPSNAVLMYNAIEGLGKTVVKLTMNNTSDPVNSTWTYSNVSGIGGGDTPSTASRNSYSRFNYIPDMGNGAGALVLADWDLGAYIYKLPSGALT